MVLKKWLSTQDKQRKVQSQAKVEISTLRVRNSLLDSLSSHGFQLLLPKWGFW